MSPRLRRRALPDERSAESRGFTLLELLVVVLVVSILAAVAAPSFLAQGQKAQAAAAQQHLVIAYHAAAASATDRSGAYVSGAFDATQLAQAIQASEPELDVVAGSCPGDATTVLTHVVVDVQATDADDLTLCNDPTHTVWTLRVLNHRLQPFSSTAVDENGQPVLGPPQNGALPLVSGTPQDQSTLSSSNGSWSNSPSSFSYQWQRDSGQGFQDLAGATSGSYLLSSSDIGDQVRACVTAQNAAGAASACSSAVAVSGAAPVDTRLPALVHWTSGSYQSDQGLWSGTAPISYGYQWQADFGQGFADIAGETGSSYIASATYIGAALRLKVTAHNLYGTTVAYSASSPTVGGAIWLNGSNGYASTSQVAAEKPSDNFKVAVWVYIRALPTSQAALVSTLTGSVGWELTLNSGGYVRFQGDSSTGPVTPYSSSTANPFPAGNQSGTCYNENGFVEGQHSPLNDGHWHYIVGSWSNSDRLRILIDGRTVECSAIGSRSLTFGSSNLDVGVRPGSNQEYFAGSVDAVSVPAGPTPSDVVYGGLADHAPLDLVAGSGSTWNFNGNVNDSGRDNDPLTLHGTAGPSYFYTAQTR